jgi:tRNA pseudouridine13 synthase
MTLLVPNLETRIGIKVYATRSSGIGGTIKRGAEDFIVEEMLVDGSKATIDSRPKVNPLGSSYVKDGFLICLLVKRNWDTISAAKAIADQLRVGIDRIHFAGLKDAKATTAQYVTIEGVSPSDVEKVHLKDITLLSIGHLHHELSQFYLLGNSFQLRISRIARSESTVRRRIRRVTEELDQEGGVPNFFGHQRFGTIRPITHQVGKAILKGDFNKAAMLFLAKPSPLEHPESGRARKALQSTGDFRQALKDYPAQLRYERSMLAHLVRNPDDYVGAFRRLPLRLFELFTEAYQSYLFNELLSRRLMQGLSLTRVETGDHVVNVERSGLPVLTTSKIASSENISEMNSAIKAGRMRLAIPLLGYRHKHSIGVNEEIEKQILEEEDISMSDFKVHATPEVSLKGKLRAAVAPLSDFFLESVGPDSTEPAGLEANIRFNLYRGSYASIVLRELMKPHSLVKAGF